MKPGWIGGVVYANCNKLEVVKKQPVSNSGSLCFIQAGTNPPSLLLLCQWSEAVAEIFNEVFNILGDGSQRDEKDIDIRAVALVLIVRKTLLSS